MATKYKNKSIAEQNSVDIAWDLLMRDEFEDLRRTIYATKEELLRFRQLIVNAVLATVRGKVSKSFSATGKLILLLAL